MSKSLTVLYNRTEEEKYMPEEWGPITIKSLRKNGKEKVNENQRGSFLMNIIPKVYEKVKKGRMKKFIVTCHKCKKQVQSKGQQLTIY